MEGTLPLPRLEGMYSLKDKTYHAIKQAIVSGTLRPHESLVENTLARQLGVSKTPVRDALLQLEREGLVVIVPFKGARVAGISLKDIREVFELRAVLEGLAARLATSRLQEEGLEEARSILLRIDEVAGNEDYEAYAAAEKEIHHLLARASDNDRLQSSLRNLDDQVERMRALAIHGPGRLTRSRQEYRAILVAIEEGNPARAEELMRSHVLAVMQELLQEQLRLEKLEVEAIG